MATFQILEDGIVGEEVSLKVHVQKLKKRDNISRVALQTINSKTTHNPKRAKLSVENIENVPIIPAVKTIQSRFKVVEEKGLENNVAIQSEYFDMLRQKNKAKTVETKRDVVDDLQSHSEYLQDIWAYLLSMEKKVTWPKPNYMRKQLHLNSAKRSVLVDWLVSVADEYSLSEQTLHLSVNYIDRFLSQMSVVKEKFQLLGSAAMMIAGKVEDIYPPDSKEWSYLTGNSYTSRQVQRMEMLLLKVLKFELQPPTMLTFIQQMCVEHKLDKETMYLAMYVSELILLEGEDYLNYLPSKLAAASVALARMLLSKKQAWPKKLVNSCGYTLKQLSPVVQRQSRTFANSPTTPQQAIQTKYQSPKYHKVALLKPKTLYLDQSEEE